MNSELGVWKAEDCALVLVDYQNEMFEVIRSETNADLVELRDGIVSARFRGHDRGIDRIGSEPLACLRDRRRVDALNVEIAKINATVVEGPPTRLGTLDVDQVVARWRRARSANPR